MLVRTLSSASLVAARQRTNAQLFGQLPRGGLFIELAGICGATDLDLIEAGKSRYLLRPPVDEDPATIITTHRRGDPMRPTLPDGLRRLTTPSTRS